MGDLEGIPEIVDDEAAIDTDIGRQLRFTDDPNEYIEQYEDIFPESENDKPPTVLDIQLVMRRSLLANSKQAEEKLSAEEKADWLTQGMSHLRLDGENIAVIENLECFSSKLTHLYLQRNRIKHVTGISMLNKLKFLVLSDNLIEVLDFDEFPKSIIILYLNGNPCTKNSDYPSNVISALPKLKAIDGEGVSQSQRKRANKLNSDENVGDTDESSDEDSSGDSDNSDSSAKHKLNDLDPNGPQVENIEELLTNDQLQVWKTSYQQVKVLSSSEEESSGPENDNDQVPSNGAAATEGAPKKKGKSKKKKGALENCSLKTDKERKNLRNLGINPAHFRDLTVKLLGRSRARQADDLGNHNKKQHKLDSYREEESQRTGLNLLPASDRLAFDRSNRVMVEVLPHPKASTSRK